MKLASNRFAFLVSVLKASEAKGVDGQMLEEILLRATSLPEAVEFMKGTDLGGFLAEYGAVRSGEMDDLLWKYLSLYFSRIKKLRPHPSVVRLIDRYMNKYDVANIITALRAVVYQTPAHMIPAGTLFDQGLLDELSRVQDPAEIASILTAGGMSDFARPVLTIEDSDRRTLRPAERRLDRLYLTRLFEAFQDMDDREILNIAYGILADYLILGRILRTAAAETPIPVDMEGVASGGYLFTPALFRELSAMKIPEIVARLEDTPYHPVAQEVARQAEQQGMLVIDRIMESERIRRVKELLSPRSLSSCAVLWHLIFKETELRNVRLALKAVEDRLHPAEVKDYLVAGL